LSLSSPPTTGEWEKLQPWEPTGRERWGRWWLPCGCFLEGRLSLKSLGLSLRPPPFKGESPVDLGVRSYIEEN
jgi:hypothetical protein